MIQDSIRWARIVFLVVVLAVPIGLVDLPPACATTFTTPCTGVRWTLQDIEANSTAVGPGLWPGTYDLLDNVTVCAGDTLVFEPGTQMWAYPETWIRVEGVLEGNGTVVDDIFLTSHDLARQWAGLRFEPGSRGNLSNCTVYVADVELLARGAQLELHDCELGGGGSALQLAEGSVADMVNVSVWDHDDQGVVVNSSTLSLVGGEIVLSSAGGLLETNGSVVRVDGTNVSLNTGGGILVFDSRFEFRNGTVYRNLWPGPGFFVQRSSVDVRDSVFAENDYYDASTSLLNVDLFEASAVFSNVSILGSSWAIMLQSTNLTVEDSEIRSRSGVVSPYGLQCFSGFPLSRVSVLRTRFIDSLVQMPDSCSVAFLDSEVQNGEVQVFGPARFSGNRFVNATVRFSPDFHSSNDEFRDCGTALEASGESAPPAATRLDNVVVTNCEVGLSVHPGSSPVVILGNGTVSASAIIVDASDGGTVFLLNTSADPAALRGASRVYVGHFLTVRALDEGDVPVAQARVVVSFEGVPVWYQDSDELGTVAWIPAPNGVLTSASTLRLESPVVTVTAPEVSFLDSPRRLDVMGPRTEVFRVDRIPPRVVRMEPAPEATEVPLSARIVIVFDKAMDTSSVKLAISVSGAEIERVEWDTNSRNFTVILSGPLAPDTRYTVTVSTAARDLGGNALAVPHAWNFTTGASTNRPVTEQVWLILGVVVVASAAIAGAAVFARRRRRRREMSSEKMADGNEQLPPPPPD